MDITEKQLLTPAELSARWEHGIHVRTLNNWRSLGTGPRYVKLGGRVLYRLADIKEFEERNTVNSTSQYGAG